MQPLPLAERARDRKRAAPETRHPPPGRRRQPPGEARVPSADSCGSTAIAIPEQSRSMYVNAYLDIYIKNSRSRQYLPVSWTASDLASTGQGPLPCQAGQCVHRDLIFNANDARTLLLLMSVWTDRVARALVSGLRRRDALAHLPPSIHTRRGRHRLSGSQGSFWAIHGMVDGILYDFLATQALEYFTNWLHIPRRQV